MLTMRHTAWHCVPCSKPQQQRCFEQRQLPSERTDVLATPRAPHLEVLFELVAQPCAHVGQDGIATRVSGSATSSKDVLAAAACSGSKEMSAMDASVVALLPEYTLVDTSIN
jgi:hypothetical protein